jgi:hypothetical protein
MKSLINDTIIDSECIDPKIFNINRMKKLLNEHLSREKNNSYFLYLILTFGTWYKNTKLNIRSNKNIL